jgi:hypothetical protein
LTDKYRELLAERETLAVAYRHSHGHPELYTPAEQSFWAHTLGHVYDEQARLEWCIDILTYREHEEGRICWWLEETQYGQGHPG